MSREPKPGRPYKNVDKSHVPSYHTMCWKCGEIFPDEQTRMRVIQPVYDDFCGQDIDDLLCKQCDSEEYPKGDFLGKT